jgi:hypothetical protein
MMGTLYVRAAASSCVADHCPRCSVLNSYWHVLEDGEIADGIDGPDFDRVRTISILAHGHGRLPTSEVMKVETF